jgi:hypothetical protein
METLKRTLGKALPHWDNTLVGAAFKSLRIPAPGLALAVAKGWPK